MKRIPIYKFDVECGKQLKKKKVEEQVGEEDGKMIGMDFGKLFSLGGGSSGVTRHKNHIYFYDDVNTENCLELNKMIVELSKELQKHSLEYDTKPAKIYLHINSYGGELLACFSTVDYIRNCPIPIVSIVEGCAASAATLMSVVCDERYMTPSSYMLIHQLRGGYWGKFDEMEEDLDNSKKFMERIYEIYEDCTKLGRKQLRKMLRKDEWWDYETCLGYGLVDGCDNGWTCNRVVKKGKKPPNGNEKDDDDGEDDGNGGDDGGIVRKVRKVIGLGKDGVRTRSMK